MHGAINMEMQKQTKSQENNEAMPFENVRSNDAPCTNCTMRCKNFNFVGAHPLPETSLFEKTNPCDLFI